jgi:hypothetical protein
MGKSTGPSPLKAIGFFIFCVLLILVPVVGLIVWGFSGPDPYLLDRQNFDQSWVGKRLKYSDCIVEVHQLESPAAAVKAAKRLFEATPAKSRVRTLNVYRYKRTDDGSSGILLPLDEYIFRIEAVDRQTLDVAMEVLPFVLENTKKNTLYNLFEEQLAAIFLVIVFYCFLLLLIFAKAGAAAAQIRPDPKIRPCIRGELRRQLLLLADLDIPITISEGKKDQLVCEWRLADEKWSKFLRNGGLRVGHRMTLQFDDEKHIVRAVATKKAVQHQSGFSGLSARMSWSRTIDFYAYQNTIQYGLDFKDGKWQVGKDYSFQCNVNQLREPVVRLIVESGWVYRPVLGFSPLLR